MIDTFRYNFGYSCVAILLVYTFQIWHRKEVVKFLNNGLDLIDELPSNNIDNKYLSIVAFFLLISSLGFLYEATGISTGLVEMSLKALMPYTTNIIFVASWTLIIVLAFGMIRILNDQIESLQTQASNETLKQVLRFYCRLHALIQTLSRLSSVIFVVNMIKFLMSLAIVVSGLFPKKAKSPFHF
jgi:7tm Chemosensory receptor